MNVTTPVKSLFMLGMLGVFHSNLIPFPKIGFFCGDPKIAHKYNGDTVTLSQLFAGSLLGPFTLMMSVEYILCKNIDGFKRAWHWFGQFAFGFLLIIFLVEAVKSLISEPRPHFLETCRPDRAINCTAGYVMDYTCTNVNVKSYLIKDSIRSFPSGHSAIGFYSSVFIIMFLNYRVPESRLLIVPWLQCICLLWGVTCALTRISDRRHHWWDVAVGAIFGTIIACYAVKKLCNDFDCGKDEVDSGKKTLSSRRLLSSTSSSDEKDGRMTSCLS